MGMTMTQKILAAHAGLDHVEAGQFIEAKLDAVLANDITGPVSIKQLPGMGADKVFDKDRVYLVPDHFTPNKDIQAAEQCKMMREFARSQELTNYIEVGRVGIEHALLPEQGLVTAGDVVIGADSHTCTYGALGAFSTGMGSTDVAAGMARGISWFKVPPALKFELVGKPAQWVSGKDIILHIIGMIGVEGARYMSMEFTGEGLQYLGMASRLTMANMAIEAGAKNGIFEVDDITLDYLKDRAKREPVVFKADPDAEYEQTFVIDLAALRPTVSFPHLPDNTRTIDEVGDIPIDQVVIGSCTNGNIADMEAAAEVLRDRQVADNVRCIIIPGTQNVYLEAIKNGWAETFIKAGAVFSTPTCGPCLGGHMGILAAGERAVTTTNRNFVGRMGHVDSEVYLASPAVAAASAIAGKIADPGKL